MIFQSYALWPHMTVAENIMYGLKLRKVDSATALKVKAMALPGVDFVSESKRFYPDGSLAAPVLGFVGTDNDGLAGLESQYDHRLTGKRGVLQVERDPQGRQLPGGGPL